MYSIRTHSKTILADTITPVSLYLKIRDIYPQSILLESSDYHGGRDNYSFICMEPVASVEVKNSTVRYQFPNEKFEIKDSQNILASLQDFFGAFKSTEADSKDKLNGFFGYIAYDAVKYFESIELNKNKQLADQAVPDIRYSLYKYIIAINHFKNSIQILENKLNDGQSSIDHVIE
jgi:anthranilate synthase component 1